ncbi:Fic family protein [Streptomyces sp. NBC_01693]|uniref:Fic family protein n=1 Tax=Streptomyces sp. NBC_01693 TaxID=2975912 RepID=UPI002E34705E|nr:Fic family protein [Streptomyces sp. NBC_01693]
MIRDLSPSSLSWDEVDPARHPFDGASAVREVEALALARRVPARPGVPAFGPETGAWCRGEAEPWADAVTYAFVRRYGIWTVGWRWAHDEGDFDGGPVGHWCCPMHSVTTPEETVARVTAALCEWREWTESLARWFDTYPLDMAAVEDQRILWERTARNLILHVVDRTGCGSGWYGHCRQVLTWFLSRWGVEPGLARELVDRAVGGRFRSWTGPNPVLVDDIAERLAGSLRPEDGPSPAEPAPDHLRRWLDVREAVPWDEKADGAADGATTPSCDGAVKDIRAFDAAIDPARADGLLIALKLMRADAARGATLDFELLRGWQRHVLGAPQPPPFRTSPAFAKDGRERYGIGPDTRARFDACLAGSAAAAGGASLPLAARAARACLDVCFFHPFDDGNGRAAFLALLFVLAREGVALDDVSMVRRFSYRADDPGEAVILARFIDLTIRETRRRALL